MANSALIDMLPRDCSKQQYKLFGSGPSNERSSTHIIAGVAPARSGKLALDPAAKRPVSQLVDSDHRLQHRHMDAGRRLGLVDDVAVLVAVDGRARRSGGQPSGH